MWKCCVILMLSGITFECYVYLAHECFFYMVPGYVNTVYRNVSNQRSFDHSSCNLLERQLVSLSRVDYEPDVPNPVICPSCSSASLNR